MMRCIYTKQTVSQEYLLKTQDTMTIEFSILDSSHKALNKMLSNASSEIILSKWVNHIEAFDYITHDMQTVDKGVIAIAFSFSPQVKSWLDVNQLEYMTAWINGLKHLGHEYRCYIAVRHDVDGVPVIFTLMHKLDDNGNPVNMAHIARDIASLAEYINRAYHLIQNQELEIIVDEELHDDKDASPLPLINFPDIEELETGCPIDDILIDPYRKMINENLKQEILETI